MMIPQAHVPDRAAPPARLPFIFECVDCERTHLSPDQQIPAGWDTFDHRGRAVVRCNDCLEAIERNYAAARRDERDEPLVVDSACTAFVDGTLYQLHSGCRICSWPMPEVAAAVVLLQPGTAPGREEGILLSLDRAQLNTLIRGLSDLAADISLQGET